MSLTPLVLVVFLGAPTLVPEQAAPRFTERPIAVEIGSAANRRGGLLDTLLAVSDDDATAAERELAGTIDDRPWVRVVGEDQPPSGHDQLAFGVAPS